MTQTNHTTDKAKSPPLPQPSQPLDVKLHLYQFAPRYKDLYERVSKGLYGFKHPRHYDAILLLRPIRKIDTRLIVEEWENIERILVSLALKTTRPCQVEAPDRSQRRTEPWN